MKKIILARTSFNEKIWFYQHRAKNINSKHITVWSYTAGAWFFIPWEEDDCIVYLNVRGKRDRIPIYIKPTEDEIPKLLEMIKVGKELAGRKLKVYYNTRAEMKDRLFLEAL